MPNFAWVNTKLRRVGWASVSGLVVGALSIPLQAIATDCDSPLDTPQSHTLPVNADTVHWGYFSQSLAPQLVVHSGDTVTVETLTHHANDAAELMVSGDPGAESVYAWTEEAKGVDRRGAGSTDPDVYENGAGQGFGVHILTGPIYICGADPGDVVAVEILEVMPRPSANPDYEGRTFGSNAAAWWGFHYNDLIEAPNPR